VKFKVLQDFIYQDGRIHAGQIVELPAEKVQHLIGSGKIEPAIHEGREGPIEIATIEPPENTLLRKRHAGK